MIRDKPDPGQESVWDYPRPPRLEPCAKKIEMKSGGAVIGESSRTLRLLETSHPPTYYIPPEDIRWENLSPGTGGSFCEFKGSAVYWHVRACGLLAENAAWSYREPSPPYAALRDHLPFYASRVDECFVHGYKTRRLLRRLDHAGHRRTV